MGGTQFAQCIPQTWYQVFLEAIYSHKERAFAKRMYLEEPRLLFHFALAALNLLCGDPKVTTAQVRGLYRSKYGIRSHRVLSILNKESLNDVLRSPEVVYKRDAYNAKVDLTSQPRKGGVRATISHFQEPNS